MGMSVWSEDDKLYVRLCGEIDHHAVASIRYEVDNMINKKRPAHLVLDLSAIEFMDSSGLGFVLGRLRHMNEYGGTLYVLNPKPRSLQMLQMAGADKLVKVIYSEIQKGSENDA